MRELEIIFTKSKKKCAIISFLIRKWTGKQYSHVARKLVHGDIELYYQASGSQVNYECKEVFDKKHEIIKRYTLSISQELYTEIGSACLREAGKPYGVLQNVGIAMVDVCRLFGKKIQNPFKQGRNCSELLYVVVLKRLCPDLAYDPDTIKPNHIEEILIDLCEKGLFCKRH